MPKFKELIEQSHFTDYQNQPAKAVKWVMCAITYKPC